MKKKRPGLAGAITEIAGGKSEDIARLYLNVFNTIPDILGILDIKYNVIAYNDAGIRFLSKNLDEVIGHKCFELINRNSPCDVCAIAEVVKTKQPARMERYFEELDLWFDVRAYPIFDKSGQVIRVIEHLRDVTSEKKAQQTLYEQEVRLSSLFQAAPVGILLVFNRNILDVNDRMCEMTGFNREELIDKNTIILYPSEKEYNIVGDEYNQIAIHGTSAVETIWKKKDGTIIDVLLSAAPLDPDDLDKGVTFTALDITDRKLAETNLRKALKEVKNLKNQLQDENIYLREEIKNEHNLDRLIGRSMSYRKILAGIEQVSATDASVLIQGETGTGKELIARAIHDRSGRKDRPMIKVNCASIPRELFESEFFGHVKGAFTGAIRDRVGRFQLADGGTLFLDEIGEIPPELQSKLLRVLQEGEFERIGEDITRKVDVRIIASTNRHLEQEIVTGNFRQDLYFRLSVFPIEVPPLRERKEDISLIAEYYLKKAYRKIGAPEADLTDEHKEQLESYWWPGNVREMQNTIERAVIISGDNDLEIYLPVIDYKINGQSDNGIAPMPDTKKIITQDELKRIEIDNIIRALEKTGWKIYGKNSASQLLGLKPSTLASRIKVLGIKMPGR